MNVKIIPNDLFFEEIAQMIATGETVKITVKGDSMRPFLRNEKDAVLLAPYQPDDLKAGTIVLFRYNSKFILHRIVGVENDTLLIQGDGVCAGYEKPLKTDVVAVVCMIIRPNGKQFSPHSFFSTTYWLCWRFLRPFRRYLLALYNLKRIV
jgi:SOS-response transcriptional repressor LexA